MEHEQETVVQTHRCNLAEYVGIKDTVVRSHAVYLCAYLPPMNVVVNTFVPCGSEELLLRTPTTSPLIITSSKVPNTTTLHFANTSRFYLHTQAMLARPSIFRYVRPSIGTSKYILKRKMHIESIPMCMCASSDIMLNNAKKHQGLQWTNNKILGQ